MGGVLVASGALVARGCAEPLNRSLRQLLPRSPTQAGPGIGVYTEVAAMVERADG